MLSEFFAQGRGIIGGSGAKQTDGGELFDWSPSLPRKPTPGVAAISLGEKKKHKERATSASISSQLQVRGKRKKEKKKEIAACLFLLVLFVFCSLKHIVHICFKLRLL